MLAGLTKVTLSSIFFISSRDVCCRRLLDSLYWILLASRSSWEMKIDEHLFLLSVLRFRKGVTQGIYLYILTFIGLILTCCLLISGLF